MTYKNNREWLNETGWYNDYMLQIYAKIRKQVLWIVKWKKGEEIWPMSAVMFYVYQSIKDRMRFKFWLAEKYEMNWSVFINIQNTHRGWNALHVFYSLINKDIVEPGPPLP